MEVLLPTSPAEAIESYGDGSGVTVVGGGTILMPEITYGRLKPSRVVLLGNAGLDRISRENGVVTIGAGAVVSALEDGDEPLASAARGIGDPEIRSQATVGGNLCATPADESPRGDLQAPLLALGARARSAGAGGERVEALEDFLADVSNRLLLDVSYDDGTRSASHAAVRRPHSHHYTILSVCAVGTGDEVRVAVTGAGPRGRRCPSVEAAVAEGAEPADAAAKVLDDVEPSDDALASAWYRRRVLPALVTRALTDLSRGSR